MAELESMPRDEIIKGNIKAFLPYICYCVKATDLLTHLQYFTKEQRKEIFQLSCSNGIEATRRAMDVILNDSQDPGRFVAFKDAISGYPKIVQMLDGEHVPCDANCQKIVDLFTLEIRLNPVHLLAALTREGTINSEDAEEIRAEEVNHSRIRACWRLLFFLPNRVDNWFKKFNEALIEYGYEDLSKILDPDFHAKIMLQKREAAEQLRKIEEKRQRDSLKREKYKESQDRIRQAQQKLQEERHKKIKEMREQQRLAQENREKQLEARRRKIELKKREEKRKQVEDRRRVQEETDRVKKEAILNKAKERLTRYEQWKTHGRKGGRRHVLGFGSRTPREVCFTLDGRRSSSQSTLRRSPKSVDYDSYFNRQAVSASSVVRRHCCIDINKLTQGTGSPPPRMLSQSMGILYQKGSPDFSSSGTLNTSGARHLKSRAESMMEHEQFNGTINKETSIKTAESRVIFQNNFDESDDEGADDSSLEIENITDTVAKVITNEAEAVSKHHTKFNAIQDSINEQYTEDLNFDFLLDARDSKGQKHSEDMNFTLEMDANAVTNDDIENQLNQNVEENNHSQELVDDVEQISIVANRAINIDNVDVADNIADSIADDIADSIADDIADSIADNIADSIAKSIADNIADRIADDIADSIADDIADDIADNIADSIADNIANSIADNRADNIAERIADNIADSIAVNISDNTADNIADSIADNIADNIEFVDLSIDNKIVADSIDDAVNLLMDNQIKEASGRDKKVYGDVIMVVDNIKGAVVGGEVAHHTEAGVDDIRGAVGDIRGAVGYLRGAAVWELQPAQEPEGAVGGQLDFSSLLKNNPFTRKVDADTLVKVLYNRKGFSLQDNMPLQNDLNFETPQNQGEVDYNIDTDEDVIDGVEDVDIPLRDYQAELAKEGCDGDNVVVMAPTNTGKTRVACKIMQEHLRRQRHNDGIGKVIFLVENEALAFQQGKVCAELLPAYRTKVISGSVQRDKKQYLRDFIDRRDILVVTAQVLVNGLKLNEVSTLTQFSLIVFDECHHTANLHRFNEIMSSYMDLKIKEKLGADKLPQVVGLTASLGVGGNTKADEAMDHMKGLLANMDAKHLCTVRRNVEELRIYENNPDERTVVVKKRQNDLYWKAVWDIMDLIDLYMHSHPSMNALPEQDKGIQNLCRVPPCRGTEQFMQWLSEFKDGIGKVRSDEVRRMLNPCRLHLEVYNKALLIHTDARTKEAEAILEEFMEEEKLIDPKDETDNMLLALYGTLERKDFSNEPPNPKLAKMQEIVMGILGNNEDARGIVFVKTRDLARALVHWMNETPPLKDLNAVEFVGQAASAAEGGMTKSGQKDALEYFKGGRHKIIIATSVAEEGLDITKCNLVIRYEHVTNEIVRLQSRGRARAQDSKYFVLTEEGSWIVAKEEKNAMLEKLMNKIVPKLQAYIEDNPNMWEKELLDMQRKTKMEEDLREEQRKNKMTADEVELRCLNCSHFVCFSSDIRVIQGAHHVIVDEDAQRRLRSERNPVPKFMEDELKFDGTTYCGNFTCQRELGGVCEYRHAEFPLIRIKNFRVVGKNGEGRTFKQWKKVNFVVQPFTLDDLRELVERRLAEIQ